MNKITLQSLNFFRKPNCVEIDPLSRIPAKAMDQLLNAEETIGRYARANGAKVKFNAGNPSTGAAVYREGDSFVSKNIEMTVDKGNVVKKRIVAYDENDNTPFLRRVYEVLQSAVEGKESAIETHKADMHRRLVEAGKIKG